MNEAAIFAARKNKTTIGNEEISDALDRVTLGPEKKNAVTVTAPTHTSRLLHRRLRWRFTHRPLCLHRIYRRGSLARSPARKDTRSFPSRLITAASMRVALTNPTRRAAVCQD